MRTARKRTGIEVWCMRRAMRRLGQVRARGERDDVLAYLGRKRANALMMADRSPDFEDEARWTVRQIEIFTDDIRAGLHLGEAAIQADVVHQEA